MILHARSKRILRYQAPLGERLRYQPFHQTSSSDSRSQPVHEVSVLFTVETSGLEHICIPRHKYLAAAKT
jgi:hypothetical protein